MGERYHTLVVALDENIDEEQAEKLREAIMQMKNVIGVEAHGVDVEFYTAQLRAKTAYSKALFKVLYGEDK